jgi:hypothetical protein
MKILLFMLVSFVAVTTTFSGLIMISNPDGKVMGLALIILDATPFKSFMIPGIVLTTVGAINVIAVFFNIQRHKNRYNWAMAGGILIMGWVIVQQILIQIFHWLQFLYLGVGILITLIAYQLKGKWIV